MIQSEHHSFLDTSVEFLKGVGPKRAKLLNKDLRIYTFADLIEHYPFRYTDRTQLHRIRELNADSGNVQLLGMMRRVSVAGSGFKKRLVARFQDETGSIDLTWFKGVQYLQKIIKPNQQYLIFGQVNSFNGRLSITHPETELIEREEDTSEYTTLVPVYSVTEPLRRSGLDSRGIRKSMAHLFGQLKDADVPETLPEYLIQKLKLPHRLPALRMLHFPADWEQHKAAVRRFKFEELFFNQLPLVQSNSINKRTIKGPKLEQLGDAFNRFYNEILSFELTGAQKRVIKEIRADVRSGRHMNRLLQGDVGSGKTIVAVIVMLMALDNDYQACLMAPTEILARQHYDGISELLKPLGLTVSFLSGSIKGKKRKLILEQLQAGEIDILIGTHALIEEWVVFKQLGIAVIDEQHRFGVAQRAKLWAKRTDDKPPHILVMTATPIPRTLAMTVYGDLDVSTIDELPPGRTPVETLVRTNTRRTEIYTFIKQQIEEGRQAYIVYPLIEESETLDLQNLEDGYAMVKDYFPEPKYQISMVHGRMKAAEKDAEMQRFVRGETQIMVATTVIEVGVNVPNASVMVIENAERFGLSQLHQLRGRVGRGAKRSYCVLLAAYKRSKEAKKRLDTMAETTDGFKIAEVDMEIRGGGDIEGTQQSGVIQFRLADLATDQNILQAARTIAQRIVTDDPHLDHPVHTCIRKQLKRIRKSKSSWSRIS